MTQTTHSAAGLPPFGMLLPTGWAAFSTSPEDEELLLRQIGNRMKGAHRPDLHAELVRYVRRAFVDLRRRDGVAMYLPVEVMGDGWPVSMTASILTDPQGAPLDGRLADVIRSGARFLDEQRTILRWEREPVPEEGMADLASLQILYAIPVPGTHRTRALLLSTSIIRDPAMASAGHDADAVALLSAVSDQIVGTFQWDPTVETAR